MKASRTMGQQGTKGLLILFGGEADYVCSISYCNAARCT